MRQQNVTEKSRALREPVARRAQGEAVSLERARSGVWGLMVTSGVSARPSLRRRGPRSSLFLGIAAHRLEEGRRRPSRPKSLTSGQARDHRARKSSSQRAPRTRTVVRLLAHDSF